MKHFKTSILASAMCLAASSLCQTASAQIHLTADLQNNHLWRGMEVADGCLILTDLSYTFGAGHATLGLWGGTNTQGNYKEFNHYVTLRGAGFEFCAMDTYNFSPGATYNNRQYFNYKAHQTGRFLNCTLNYRFQQPRFPLLLSWSTIMFGRDRSADNTAEILYVRLRRISRLQEGRMAGGRRCGRSVRSEQGWREAELLRRDIGRGAYSAEGEL